LGNLSIVIAPGHTGPLNQQLSVYQTAPLKNTKALGSLLPALSQPPPARCLYVYS